MVAIEHSGNVQPDRNILHILLVDDSIICRRVGTDVLEDMGHRVTTAINGQEAVNTFSEIHDDIDLVLLDMNMPVMDGYECFYHLKKIDPKVKIIIVTGDPFSDKLQGLINDGALGCLSKPFDFEELISLFTKT